MDDGTTVDDRVELDGDLSLQQERSHRGTSVVRSYRSGDDQELERGAR
jgi:hypothetical protein